MLLLATAIQEELRFRARIERGKEPIQEHELCRIAAVPDWRKQRQRCRKANLYLELVRA
jgi:hypothetical protein